FKYAVRNFQLRIISVNSAAGRIRAMVRQVAAVRRVSAARDVNAGFKRRDSATAGRTRVADKNAAIKADHAARDKQGAAAPGLLHIGCFVVKEGAAFEDCFCFPDSKTAPDERLI